MKGGERKETRKTERGPIEKRGDKRGGRSGQRENDKGKKEGQWRKGVRIKPNRTWLVVIIPLIHLLLHQTPS